MNHATSWPLDPRVLRFMTPLLEAESGGPGSPPGRDRVAEVLDQARDRVAVLVEASPGQIIFTSGGTEACNLAIKGVGLARLIRAGSAGRIVVGATERPAVLHPARTLAKLGAEVVEVPVGPDGVLALDRMSSLMEGAALVTVSFADEETGTCQPMAEIARMARARGVLLHADASLAAGYRRLSVRDLDVDLLSLSSHRMGGPRGAGALYVREGVRLLPLIEGGTQESGRRAGMPFVAGLAGFGEAARLRVADLQDEQARLDRLGRDLARALSLLDGVRLNGHPDRKLHPLVNISASGLEGEAILLKLRRRGVTASTGSSCAEQAGKPSRVLAAMGIPEALARSSILFSLGPRTTDEDVVRTVDAMAEALAQLRALAPGPAA
ncbi:MAG: cysteine desulfurase family protein [Candidatus Polarisedimenticolia bacterium]